MSTKTERVSLQSVQKNKYICIYICILPKCILSSIQLSCAYDKTTLIENASISIILRILILNIANPLAPFNETID